MNLLDLHFWLYRGRLLSGQLSSELLYVHICNCKLAFFLQEQA